MTPSICRALRDIHCSDSATDIKIVLVLQQYVCIMSYFILYLDLKTKVALSQAVSSASLQASFRENTCAFLNLVDVQYNNSVCKSGKISEGIFVPSSKKPARNHCSSIFPIDRLKT